MKKNTNNINPNNNKKKTTMMNRKIKLQKVHDKGGKLSTTEKGYIHPIAHKSDKM